MQPLTYYYLTDHLGTIHALADENGDIVESYKFDAWGRVLEIKDGNGNTLTESALGNRYLWQGREYSYTTGLYYFRARWYDPITARWLSKDPIGISGGLNQYVFCGNNPVNYVDPFGLKLWQVQYWSDRSIRGGWLNRSFSTVMGVMAACVPDVITVDGRIAGALLGGGEFGGGAIINLNDLSISGYDTRGLGVGHQPVAPSLTGGVGWNTEVVAPSNSDFAGPFNEFTVSAGSRTASYYIGGGWQGVNYGVTTPGFGYMYSYVEYDIWDDSSSNQSSNGDCK